MKRFISCVWVALLLLLASCRPQQPAELVYADIPPYYLTLDEVVDSHLFLPPPPDSGSARWLYDAERYAWGKTLRDTPRGQLAVRDAYIHDEYLCESFSEAFGVALTPDNAPAIVRLIAHMREDAGDLATRHAKSYYKRPRPFVVFNEHTPLPDEEPSYSLNGSSPSGHASMGWAVALVLSEINPGRALQIMQRGYEIGESRVILGFHFDSDVQAGRICAAIVVARLHDNENFLADLAAAKAEFRELVPSAS